MSTFNAVRYLKLVAICITLAAVSLSPVFARQPDETVDPQVFKLFLHMYDALQQEIARRNQNGQPGGGQPLRQGAMGLFGLNASDFDQAGGVIRSINQQLKSTHERLIAYRDECKSNQRMVDPIVIKGFTATRQQIVASGMKELERAISPAGWQNLKTYLNETVKPKVRQIKLTGPAK